MDINKLSRAAICYVKIALSTREGFQRILDAGLSSQLLFNVFLRYENHKLRQLEETSEILKILDEMSCDEFDSLDYITDVSFLVYATSILDSFLSDTTLFLFLLHPASMGTNHQITLQLLIDASSKNEALTNVARKRAREISYKTFVDRIKFLEDTFSLKFNFDPGWMDSLIKYSSIRNEAVHDQGIYKLLLNEDDKIESQQKLCISLPIQLTIEEALDAVGVYSGITEEIIKSMMAQVLKCTKDSIDGVPLSEFFENNNP
jgi:hypothetical protein